MSIQLKDLPEVIQRRVYDICSAKNKNLEGDFEVFVRSVPDFSLETLIDFSDTPEGKEFWTEINLGNFVEPDGNYKCRKLIKIKLKNDLWRSQEKWDNLPSE
jgi:hypothetical protein